MKMTGRKRPTSKALSRFLEDLTNREAKEKRAAELTETLIDIVRPIPEIQEKRRP
jgi:hypothetical protein